MAVKVSLQRFVKVLKSDSKYKRLYTTFSTHENFTLPLEDFYEELRTGHKLRKVRKLNSTDPNFVDKLITAVLNDQSLRSRTTEILIQCSRSHALMEEAVTKLRYHLLLSYGEELVGFRTKEERLQIVNMALSPFNTFLSEASTLKESCLLLTADIDKAAWALKSLVEAFKIHSVPETRL
jgi:hypothetical protein